MSVLRTVIASTLMAAGGVACLAAATNGFQALTSQSARSVEIREHPRPVPAVMLQDQDGHDFNFASLHGKWVIVDFMYTRCTTLCMVMGSQFGQLARQLRAPIARGRIQLLSVSFDPAYDRPKQLAGYLARFGAHGEGWLAARPTTPHGLERLERVFGIFVVPDGTGGFVHNDGFEIVDPQGRLVDVAQTYTPISELAATLRRYAGGRT